MTRSYATPLAFKAALEARLHERAVRQGRSLNRVRQLLVMERFLARVFPAIGSAVLKGGLVMELRLDRACATKDVDLRVSVRISRFWRAFRSVVGMAECSSNFLARPPRVGERAGVGV